MQAVVRVNSFQRLVGGHTGNAFEQIVVLPQCFLHRTRFDVHDHQGTKGFESPVQSYYTCACEKVLQAYSGMQNIPRTSAVWVYMFTCHIYVCMHSRTSIPAYQYASMHTITQNVHAVMTGVGKTEAHTTACDWVRHKRALSPAPLLCGSLQWRPLGSLPCNLRESSCTPKAPERVQPRISLPCKHAIVGDNGFLPPPPCSSIRRMPYRS